VDLARSCTPVSKVIWYEMSKEGTEEPPDPFWVLRQHMPCAINALHFFAPTPTKTGSEKRVAKRVKYNGSLFLAAGDSHGQVSVTDLSTYRQTAFWKAHDDSILGVELLAQGRVVTHGRDNKVHVWELMKPQDQQRNAVAISSNSAGGQRAPHSHLPSRMLSSLPLPKQLLSLEVNSLNYCRFSMLTARGNDEALIAVPHTLESAYIDIYHLPTCKRLAKAIGKPDIASTSAALRESRQAITMAMHLFESKDGKGLALLAGYEDGSVALWTTPLKEATTEGVDWVASAQEPWQQMWRAKHHAETGVYKILGTET
jgi:ASTRA-associated protein 1